MSFSPTAPRVTVVLAVVLTVFVSSALGIAPPAGPEQAGQVDRPAPIAVRADSDRGALDIGCDELAPTQLIADAVGSHGAPAGREDLHGISFAIPEAAIFQDGGLVCEWSEADAEYPGYFYPRLTVKALPDAQSMFARNLDALLNYSDWSRSYESLQLFDGTAVSCDGGYVSDPDVVEYQCIWQVLTGDVWLEVSMEHLPASAVVITDGAKPFDGLHPVTDDSASVALLSAIVASFEGAHRTLPGRAVSELPDCADFVPTIPLVVYEWDDATQSVDAFEVEASALQVDDSIESLPGSHEIRDSLAFVAAGGKRVEGRPGDMWQFAFERLGFRDCEAKITVAGSEPGSSGVTYFEEFFITRGMNWFVEPRNAVPLGERVDVDGLGVLFDAYCLNEESCSDMMLSGDVLLGFPYGDGRAEIIQRWRSMMAIINASPA